MMKPLQVQVGVDMCQKRFRVIGWRDYSL